MKVFLVIEATTIAKVVDSSDINKGAVPQASELPASQKFQLKKGFVCEVDKVRIEGVHYFVSLSKAVNNHHSFYVYSPHVKLEDESGMPFIPHAHYDVGDRLPEKVNLDVPYLYQGDNKYEPWKTCNVTSVAMVLRYYKIPQRTKQKQFEDELNRHLIARGLSRYWHSNLVSLMKDYGVESRFSTTTPWETVKRHLANGKPVIVAGNYTHKGHIIVLRGYDRSGFLANDPAGRWLGIRGRYRYGSYGENVHYPYQNMYNVSNGGSKETWAHLTGGNAPG